MDATTSLQGSSGAALFPMPPPPQLLQSRPRPSSLSSLSLSSSYSHHAPPSITNFPILVLTVLGILTTSVLLLAYYVFVIRCCLNWHHHRGGASSISSTNIPAARGRRQRQRAGASSTALPTVSAAAEPPRGLEEAAIRALPAFRYSSSRNKDKDDGECAVCLGEFEDGDRVRLLPGCLHVFHVACIDNWLHANANCPLCRAHIATAHCLQLRLPPPADQQQLREREVAIHLEALVPGGAEQQDQATTPPQAQGRQHATAASLETAGQPPAAAAADNNQVVVVVVGGQTKSINACCCHENEIHLGIGSKVDDESEAETKDGDPPRRRSLSTATGSAAGGEAHLQIHHDILQGNDDTGSHSHRDDDEHDTVTAAVQYSA